MSKGPISPRGAAIGLSHGGGPMPILGGDPYHHEIISSLKNRVPKILRVGTADAPRAIVLVTAHWRGDQPQISSQPRPKLLYDYYGFPPEAYELKYDAPGSPEVAKEVFEVLSEAGFKPEVDEERGWDHGVFIPLLLINPRADIPIVQVSVLSSSTISQHYQMGRALSRLRSSNVAIIGSGSASFHNLRSMFTGVLSDPDFLKVHEKWSKDMAKALTIKDSEERQQELEKWRKWEGSKEMHPNGATEHFMPLVVCAGAGGNEKADSYGDQFGNIKMWSYYWTD